MNISIIIPFRNESKNVEVISERMINVLPEVVRYNVIFFDDGDDDTTSCLERLSHGSTPIRYLRCTERTGFATAILDGFKLTQGEWFIVMIAY